MRLDPRQLQENKKSQNIRTTNGMVTRIWRHQANQSEWQTRATTQTHINYAKIQLAQITIQIPKITI